MIKQLENTPTRIHPQGKAAPRMFLELARPKSDGIGLESGGGVQFLLKSKVILLRPKFQGFLMIFRVDNTDYIVLIARKVTYLRAQHE